MNLNDLKQEIPYKWRTGPGGTQLAYIDARDAMDLLDKVVGPENWQDKYEFVGDKLIAGVGIKCGCDWIWKYDTGVESNIEEEKGQFSDAFKRACVKWGVGRFLYDVKPTHTTHPKISSVTSQNAPQSNITPKMVNDTTTDGESNLGTVSGKIPDNAKAYGKCPKCGAPNKLSASGTIYCSAKCWLNGR